MRARALLPALAFLVTASAAAWAQQAPTSTPLLKATTDAKGQPIEYPRSGRHQHPVPTHLYILEGSLMVDVEGGERQEYRLGADQGPCRLRRRGRHADLGPRHRRGRGSRGGQPCRPGHLQRGHSTAWRAAGREPEIG